MISKRLSIELIVRKIFGMQNGQMAAFNASVANFSADRIKYYFKKNWSMEMFSQIGCVNQRKPINAFFCGRASPLDKLRTGFTQPYQYCLKEIPRTRL